MDFTTFSFEPRKTGSHKKDTAVYVQNCIVVFEYLDSSGIPQLEYLDFICDCSETNKNDYHFVLNVWLKLFNLKQLNQRYDSIEIWTDGGPHHFKTRYCQWMWHFLSTMRFNQKRITHNFFSSYHGHSLADSHAATDKRLLRTQYQTSQQQRLLPTEADLYWGPSSAADLAALLGAHASQTEAFVLPSIIRDEEDKPDIQPIDHIKKQHCFVYENNTCTAYERTAKDAVGRTFQFVPIV
jgi:hypothetical protein